MASCTRERRAELPHLRACAPARRGSQSSLPARRWQHAAEEYRRYRLDKDEHSWLHLAHGARDPARLSRCGRACIRRRWTRRVAMSSAPSRALPIHGFPAPNGAPRRAASCSRNVAGYAPAAAGPRAASYSDAAREDSAARGPRHAAHAEPAVVCHQFLSFSLDTSLSGRSVQPARADRQRPCSSPAAFAGRSEPRPRSRERHRHSHQKWLDLERAPAARALLARSISCPHCCVRAWIRRCAAGRHTRRTCQPRAPVTGVSITFLCFPRAGLPVGTKSALRTACTPMQIGCLLTRASAVADIG